MRLSFSLLLHVSSLATVGAFAPSLSCVRTNSVLFSTRPDTTQYVGAALEASKTYGPTSKEAILAWETVEEMDSADNSNAYTGGESSEYQEKLQELTKLIQAGEAPKLDRMKNLATEISAIKLANPSQIAGADSPLLRQALESAKKATEEFGVDSSQAKLAWEDVEEIASASAASFPNMIDECLVEEIEACQGLEELTRVLNLDQQGSRYSG